MQADQAPVEDSASRSSHADLALSYKFQGKHCRVDEVAKLVGKKTQAFIHRVFTRVSYDPIMSVSERRDCIGNRIIEASIE
jgi:hypothetical protein